MAKLFSMQRKIRFSHCDPAGIVYFVHFFDMINGCVEDWFAEAVGVSSQELLIKRRVGFPIVNTRCEFFRPCHLSDILVLDLRIAALGRSSIEFAIGGRVGAEHKFQAHHKVAMMSLDTLKSVAIDDELRSKMREFVAASDDE
ncbi:MAG: acyl-CoA thioesterase [Betaproteobacteria bacterium]|nr:MAG: acyl-CoA thioesterase [Betaproteobacteria bacterium]